MVITLKLSAVVNDDTKSILAMFRYCNTLRVKSLVLVPEVTTNRVANRVKAMRIYIVGNNYDNS